MERTWHNLGLRVVIANPLPFPEGDCSWVRADGRALPFADRSFDLVFSNSVIEHVGNEQSQAQFAGEIRRVGRRYWVQAPNRYFPVEPHFNFPAFQFLPMSVRVWVARIWPYSWPKQNEPELVVSQARSIRLPSVGEMLNWFPGATVYPEKFLGLTKSVMMYGRANSSSAKLI
jgi:hypothetical protein